MHVWRAVVPGVVAVGIAAWVAQGPEPIPESKALEISNRFVQSLGLSFREAPLHTTSKINGLHDFQYGGEASVRVDFWSGRVTSFTNLRRQYDNHMGLRKGIERAIFSEAKARNSTLIWASRLKLKKESRSIGAVQFSRNGPTIWVGFEERPHGYRFLQHSDAARLEIDATDGQLITYWDFPNRVVDSWDLKVKPEDVRPTAIDRYKSELAKVSSDKPNLKPSYEIGYVMDPGIKPVDPSKGPSIIHFRLAIAFKFAESPSKMFGDHVAIDAGTGKVLSVTLYPRPKPSRRGKPPPNG